ncbi:uncharacterized protein C9orf85 homolog isoform X2 [Monodelphis domestica]|uniref:uncharacterized protein C9orf85 homolog isoform X2 n=1 Tax=Monodelphis domestica TaxID=13616 RepID=UPI0000F2DCE8|nr:uncharacterized protein C9orf85 homolog isoform X2 [Monodelphis domestica]
MSSQKGNVARTRPQRHQNAFSFKNDKFDTSVQTKRINAKLHEGVCQHCKEVLEWRVKYSKYKPLSKPKKCVKCSQKTVKDSYHMICRPCAYELEVCAKCGKKEEIVIPISNRLEKTADVESDEISNSRRRNGRLEEQSSDELDFDLDLNESEDEEQTNPNSYTKNKSASAKT